MAPLEVGGVLWGLLVPMDVWGLLVPMHIWGVQVSIDKRRVRAD